MDFDRAFGTFGWHAFCMRLSGTHGFYRGEKARVEGLRSVNMAKKMDV